MKSKATGCGSISTVFPSIVLQCVSSIIVIIVVDRIDKFKFFATPFKNLSVRDGFFICL